MTWTIDLASLLIGLFAGWAAGIMYPKIKREMRRADSLPNRVARWK